jgi:hypothetical protein
MEPTPNSSLVRPRKSPDEAALDVLRVERQIVKETPLPTIFDFLDSAKFEIAQTKYLIQQINILRTLPAVNLPPLTAAQVRQGIIDIYNALP